MKDNGARTPGIEALERLAAPAENTSTSPSAPPEASRTPRRARPPPPHTGAPTPRPSTRLVSTPRCAGKNALLVCDTTEMCDALNRRLHDETIDADAPGPPFRCVS